MLEGEGSRKSERAHQTDHDPSAVARARSPEEPGCRELSEGVEVVDGGVAISLSNLICMSVIALPRWPSISSRNPIGALGCSACHPGSSRRSLAICVRPLAVTQRGGRDIGSERVFASSTPVTSSQALSAPHGTSDASEM
jgi:hypothetical protein